MVNRFALFFMSAAGLQLAFPGFVDGQARVKAVYATAANLPGNVDSCAVWVAPDPADSLLFSTEKDGDRVTVWHATDGQAYAPRPFLGGVPDGSGPGELNRPNGVWVIYHVPYAGGFADVLIVTDQMNRRVEVFRLPQLDLFGEFGKDQVGKGYGIAWYQDGTDFFVYITDNIPPAAFPGKIKKYRLRPEGNGLGADLIFGVGSSAGPPPLLNVESIAADLFNDRLHVCGDEGGRFNRIFRLDGTYTGVDYGDPQFEFDQEGINIYDTGNGRGYLLVSDQYTDGTPNQFEVFDRVSLASLGNFLSAPGPIITRNTDGDYLEQRPLAGFPNGGFFAVNDDRNTHAYDWTDIAEAMGLQIVALDRSFGVDPAPPAASPAGPGRRALWFEDGSYWGIFPRDGQLSIHRLEDGTFAPQESFGVAAPASVWAGGGRLAVLAAGTEPRLFCYEYFPELRRYLELEDTVIPGPAGNGLLELEVEADPSGGPFRGWIAWSAAGKVQVTWSESPMLGSWNPQGVELGDSSDVLPRLSRLDGAVAVLFTGPEGVCLRVHADADLPQSWSPAEVVDGRLASSLALAAAPGGRLIAAAVASGGSGWLRARSASGAWGAPIDLGPIDHPALVTDAFAGQVHLFSIGGTATHRVVNHRAGSLASLDLGPPRLAIGWPGVSLEAPVFLPSLPEAAGDLVAAARGDDGRGYFSREEAARTRDIQSPITQQHRPPPGATEIAGGSPISFRITDDRSGVDRSSIRVLANGVALAARTRGVPGNFLVAADLPGILPGPSVHLRIEARDLAAASNVMAPFEYDLFLETGGEPAFRRGDANADGVVDISDPLRILFALFAGAPPIACADAADANDDGASDIADPVFILDSLFLGTGALPLPGPGCGIDPTADALDCAGDSGCGG
jgi:3-phytase